MVPTSHIMACHACPLMHISNLYEAGVFHWLAPVDRLTCTLRRGWPLKETTSLKRNSPDSSSLTFHFKMLKMEGDHSLVGRREEEVVVGCVSRGGGGRGLAANKDWLPTVKPS